VEKEAGRWLELIAGVSFPLAISEIAEARVTPFQPLSSRYEYI
jgi:hypothetical protein